MILKPQMDADERGLKIDKITEKIIGLAYDVANTLGCGFLEKVYENAMVIDGAGAPLRGPVTIEIEEDRIVGIHGGGIWVWHHYVFLFRHLTA